MSALSQFLTTPGNGGEQPLGTLLSSLATEQSDLPPGWVALDGSLLSRQEYPDAERLLGDVRFFNATSTLVSVPLQSGFVIGGTLSTVARGNDVLLAGQSSKIPSTTNTAFILRSEDAGETFEVVRLTPGITMGMTFNAQLHWMGASRVLLIISTGGSHYYVACSEDMGRTWTSLWQLAGASGTSVTVASDGQTTASGTGHAYIGVSTNDGGSGRVFAVHWPSAQPVLVYTADAQTTYPTPIAGEAASDGTSTLVFMRKSGGYSILQRVSVNAQTGTVNLDGSTGSGSYHPSQVTSVTSGRFWVRRGADGRHYLAVNREGGVYRLGFGLLLTPTLVFNAIGAAGPSLLDNLLFNNQTGDALDVDAGVFTPGCVPNSLVNHWGGRSTVATDRAVWNTSPGLGGRVCAADSRALIFVQGPLLPGFTTGNSNLWAIDYLNMAASPVLESWYDPGTGVLRQPMPTADGLYVQSWVPAEDYAQYLQLPFMAGLICRLK